MVRYTAGYRLKDGLIGMPSRGHLAVIDTILDEDESSPEDRRELLMDHELLAAATEFHLLYPRMTLDEDGCEYLPLGRGRRACDPDSFLGHLCRYHPAHLQRLTSLVRHALFTRFIEDAAAA
jgi:hypothetical protein